MMMLFVCLYLGVTKDNLPGKNGTYPPPYPDSHKWKLCLSRVQQNRLR